MNFIFRELYYTKMVQNIDYIGLVEIVNLGSSPVLDVADKLLDSTPLCRVLSSEPQTPEYRHKIVNLLHVSLRVEYEHVLGVHHQLTLWTMLGYEGAVLLAEG